MSGKRHDTRVSLLITINDRLSKSFLDEVNIDNGTEGRLLKYHDGLPSSPLFMFSSELKQDYKHKYYFESSWSSGRHREKLETLLRVTRTPHKQWRAASEWQGLIREAKRFIPLAARARQPLQVRFQRHVHSCHPRHFLRRVPQITLVGFNSVWGFARTYWN